MDNKNISLKQNQPERKRATRDMQRFIGEPFAEKVITAMEEQRRKRRKTFPLYTQEYVAEKAGISLSTYKGYVSGRSHHIDLITAKGIADVLGCRLSDIIKQAEH